MGGAVVDPQGERSPADVDPQGAPGERRLEDPLAEVTGEEQSVRAPGAEGGQEAQLGHSDVLRLVHHAELERRMRHLRELALQDTEQARFGQKPVLVQSGGHLGENRPEELPLPFGKASPPTEPRHVPILFPACELPGVDDAAPLGPQETQAEPEVFDLGGGLAQQLAHPVGGRQIGAAEVRLMEPPPDVGHRVHLQPFGDVRLIGDESHHSCAQGISERRGERGQQDAGIRVGAGKMHRAMQRYDGLAGSGRS